MSLFNWLSDVFGFGSSVGASTTSLTNDFCVNPANGLPMIDGMGSVDIQGNPFGTDSSPDLFGSTGMFDSGSSSSGTGFSDDSWMSSSSSGLSDDSWSSSSGTGFSDW